LCKKKNLSTTVRKKKKNTDTRAIAVTKLLALKNDYLNNPKRKKNTGQRQSKRTKQTNKNLKIVRARISKNKQTIFPPLYLSKFFTPKLSQN